MSVGQAFLNNRDLNYILNDASRGAVEKVVVRKRNVPVPPLPSPTPSSSAEGAPGSGGYR